MLNHIDFFQSRLEARLDSTMTVMRIRASHGVLDRLNKLPEGDHIYLVLRYRNRVEVVKYTHTQPLQLNAGQVVLPIERGQHDTTITSWGAGICVSSELTHYVLNEWWAQKNCGC